LHNFILSHNTQNYRIVLWSNFIILVIIVAQVLWKWTILFATLFIGAFVIESEIYDNTCQLEAFVYTNHINDLHLIY